MPIYWIGARAAQTPAGQQMMKKVTGELNQAMALAAAGAAVIWSYGEAFMAIFDQEEQPEHIFDGDPPVQETTVAQEGLPGNATKSDLQNAGWTRVRRFGEGGEPLPY